MALSNNLVSQFVKVVNNNNKTNKRTEINGTVVSHDGTLKVRLDGSDILTPVNTTTELKENQRVSVKIVDHRATVVGNMSAPSIGSETATAIADNAIGEFDKVITGILIANYAEINELIAGKATIEDLRATNAEITKLIAADAEITQLVAKKIDADEVEAKYVKVDLAEMDEAWVDDLIVKSSFLSPDVNSATGSFSTRLEAVNIYGDSIVSNTIKADSLIIKGTDGIYRRLNIDSLGQTKVDSDVKYNNQLDGSVIVANSITASKINVTDLFAQDITATGTITGMTFKGVRGDFTGTINADSGRIAMFSITDNGLDASLNNEVLDYRLTRRVFRATTYPTSNPTAYANRVGELSLSEGYLSGYAESSIVFRSPIFNVQKIDGTNMFTVDNNGVQSYVISRFSNAIESLGESKFVNPSYSLGIWDTAEGVACAFKASRGLFNEALVDKLIMTTGTGKLPFYKYTGASDGQMSGLTEIASINNSGTFSGAGVSVTGTVSANNATIASTLEVKGSIQAKGGLELYHASTPYFDFHHGGTTTDYTSRIIETASGTLAVNGVQCKTGGYLTVPGTLDVAGITTVKARIQPNSSVNTVNLGYNDVANSRWANIYSKTSVNVSSDIKVKTDLAEIDDRYILLFDLVMPYSYKFVDGTSGRTHTGFISQYVEDALIQVGLDATDLAFFCKDPMVEEIRDEDGNVIDTKPLLDENGEQVYFYSLRYEEYIAIMVAKMKKMERDYEARISALESKGENQNG